MTAPTKATPPAASLLRSAGVPFSRHIAIRYDKLDAVLLAFIHLGLIYDSLP